MPLAYLSQLVKIVLRSPVALIAPVVLAVYAIAPHTYSTGSTGGDAVLARYSSETYVQKRDTLEWAKKGDRADELVPLLQRELDALQKALSAKESRSFFDAASEYESAEIAIDETGAYGSTYTPELRANAQTVIELAKMDDPVVYETIGDEPALYYVVANAREVPQVVWLIPAFVASILVARARSGFRLLAQAPISPLLQSFVATACIVVYSLGCLFLAYAPALVLAFLNAGVGDPSYPCVFIQGGVLHVTTVGATLVRLVILYALLSLMAAVFGELLFAALRSLWAVACPIVMLACASGVPGYYDGLVPNALLSWLPTTYAFIPFVSGYATYFNGEDITGVAGVSFDRGLTVLASCSTAAIVAILLCLLPLCSHAARQEARELVVRGLSLGFSGHTILNKVSFSIVPGEIVGLVAPNGAGKTTLLGVMAGSCGKDEAKGIAADGLSPASHVDYHRTVFFVPGDGSSLYEGLTVREHIAMTSRLWESKVDSNRIIESMGMSGYAMKRCGRLSQGMRQQVLLACSYVTGASYLLLDEPMNALDPSNVRINTNILRRMAERGCGILLSSHLLDNLDALCESVILIVKTEAVKVELSESRKRVAEIYEETYPA